MQYSLKTALTKHWNIIGIDPKLQLLSFLHHPSTIFMHYNNTTKSNINKRSLNVFSACDIKIIPCILCFNNIRTLHVPASHTVTQSSNRHLEGNYLEWDEYNATLADDANA